MNISILDAETTPYPPFWDFRIQAARRLRRVVLGLRPGQEEHLNTLPFAVAQLISQITLEGKAMVNKSHACVQGV